MQILKAYKYRIYPNNVQEEYLNRNFGAVRFLWNQFVASFNSYGKGPIIPQDEMVHKSRNGWMNECISYALQQKRMDWVEFTKQHFNKKRKTKLGRPKYKKKGQRDSFRIPVASMGGGNVVRGIEHINLDAGRIKLPKMTPMKMIVDRKFTGIPKSVTVSKNSSCQYFVSILVEEELELKQNTGRSIGIDLGLNHLAIMSNGIKIDNPRWFRETQSKLKKAQQHLSRKTKGSKRYNRQRIKVAKIYQKISNQRNFLHHNLSAWLVHNYDTICMENLNVKGMVKNRSMAKSISDASWSTLVSMISYKSIWRGRSFQQIDRFYPSSKTCSCCGYKIESMDLSVREWECPSCNTGHDRDLNAAINILHEGLKGLYGFTSEELSDYKRREELRPKALVPKASSLKRLVSFINFHRTT